MKILVVDDEEFVCRSCQRILAERGHSVETTQHSLRAFEMIRANGYDLVILDIKMPGMSGMELLQRVKETSPEVDVLMITGYASIETAVNAMKLGAFDYICKPFSPDELAIVVGRIAEKRRHITEAIQFQQELWDKYHLKNIVGNSPKIRDILRLVVKIAPTESVVLIRGESGVGKELVARAIHVNSPRRDHAFVVVDCASITETLIESELFGHIKGAFTDAVANKKGLLEVANGGTVFLDEIGNVPVGIQVKLLRFLQEREFRPVGDTRVMKSDVRVIAATNRDLEQMIKEGKFRDDLYYRLNVFPITVPPLRERKEDIAALAVHFMKKVTEETKSPIKRVSAEAMSVLVAYDWPGNIRELENAIRSAVILAEGEYVRPEHLPAFVKKNSEPSLKIPKNNEELKEYKKIIREKSVEQIERAFVLEALERNGWNVTKAATETGMQRTQFQFLMKKYGVHIREKE